MVKAIAPNAPTGASCTTMRMTPKKISDPRSITFSTECRCCSASPVMANAVRPETSSTCRRSPVTKAEKSVAGMMLRKKAVIVCDSARLA